MQLRGRSRDRETKSTPPGPVYMSNEEFAEYLKNLRNSRVARPKGARPLSLTTRSEVLNKESSNHTQEGLNSEHNHPSPEIAIRSHRRAQSSLSNTYSSAKSRTGRLLPQQTSLSSEIPLLKPSDVVPSATYIERGQRWMEKEEAVALREAMEDMDSSEDTEENRIYAAAHKEACELVWQHKNPQLVGKPDQPYRYKNHLRKNSYQVARTESVGRRGSSSLATGLARDIPVTIRSFSGGSSSSEGMTVKNRRSSDEPDLIRKRQSNLDSRSDKRSGISVQPATDFNMKSTAVRTHRNSQLNSGNPSIPTRNSGRRNISGEIKSGPFRGDQIWEEPEQQKAQRERPQVRQDVPVSHNLKSKPSTNHVQFAKDVELRSNSTPPEPSKRVSIFEIHKNPPPQTINSRYVANHPTNSSENGKEKAHGSLKQTKEVLEIRSEEIRQATSMRLKDRSPKLPLPSVISDRPGRPIVSFDPNWKPKEADLKSEIRKPQVDNLKPKQILPTSPTTKTSSSSSSASLVPSRPSVEINCQTEDDIPNSEKLGSRSCHSAASPSRLVPSIPSINITEMPSISISSSSSPVIGVEEPESKPKRPLPIPRSNTNASVSAINPDQGHWSPAAGKRATIACSKCRLPIQNRVLKIGANEHFHPKCFCCTTCGSELESLEIYPEPSSKRIERLDRIRRRAEGEQLPEIEGQTEHDDGDESDRYYCHLDFHENFAPRCKHCKTPIIGEHIVALGEHWHPGHFFCAECGDPFRKGMTHIQKDSYAWCINCQIKRTERQAPKCKKCRKAVIGEYVRALGGEWHEQCFRCAVCQKGFDDGSFYPKQVDDEQTIVLCIHCIELELKA
ncbi:putative lim domain-containing protein [Golovinomyces cichoracearum]|uniref:Putative lim domain-containing protein n=1 Tax=Golovinomyces cichoracearum TaxID=62708 RepID=A0A420IDS1_9PEZI|nr:putative lim domain-containing protein [Golovinomyces cichoracearum]